MVGARVGNSVCPGSQRKIHEGPVAEVKTQL